MSTHVMFFMYCLNADTSISDYSKYYLNFQGNPKQTLILKHLHLLLSTSYKQKYCQNYIKQIFV